LLAGVALIVSSALARAFYNSAYGAARDMGIRIVPHSTELSAAVEAFNGRMRAGGSPWGLSPDPVPTWLPKRPGQHVWREWYAAVDETSAVRGGFVLKPQNWLVRGQMTMVTDWQGPVSEGSVDPRYAWLAVRLIREMVIQRPALYSWGHGGNEQPVLQILRKMGWLLHGTPFCLLVVKPSRFLRLNAYLRTSPPRRAALDFLAYTGAGSAGLRTLHALLRLRSVRRFGARAEPIAGFGAWADELWQRCKDRYTAIAVRDAVSMNALAPAGSWPPVTRLRVHRRGHTIGWALVMDTRMQDDARFGDLHVGSIVDCFADPRDAGEIVSAATDFIRRRGVDVIVSNQSHPEWIRGFAENGYLTLANRRFFVASPELKRILEPFAETAGGLHLTNMDGHGPHSL
jgi:hypothetical protein